MVQRIAFLAAAARLRSPSSLSDLTANSLILLKWYYFLKAKSRDDRQSVEIPSGTLTQRPVITGPPLQVDLGADSGVVYWGTTSYLSAGVANSDAPQVTGLRRGLNESGYTEGRNVEIGVRHG